MQKKHICLIKLQNKKLMKFYSKFSGGRSLKVFAVSILFYAKFCVNFKSVISFSLQQILSSQCGILRLNVFCEKKLNRKMPHWELSIRRREKLITDLKLTQDFA